MSEVSNGKLMVIDGERKPATNTVTQLRLAIVLSLEAEIAGLQEQLDEARIAILADLRHGATIEEGPHRLSFQSKLVIR
jgi:hypothetical protein